MRSPPARTEIIVRAGGLCTDSPDLRRVHAFISVREGGLCNVSPDFNRSRSVCLRKGRGESAASILNNLVGQC
jgi:hypothetical protein